jgi:DNA ligase (NAD+)
VNKSQAQERITKLRKEIEHHRYLYHVLDTQEISDAALDSLKKELADLEKQFPSLITPDSPTQRVSGMPLEKFEKVEHRLRMYSLNDVFSHEEVEEWEERLKKLLHLQKAPEYFAELKMDGLAISLTYEEGELVLAATRGDGRVGENVTLNARTLESVPLRLRLDGVKDSVLRKKITQRVEVRGEVVIHKDTFEKLNKKLEQEGKVPYANPRNLAAGAVRQLDPKMTAARELHFYAYDIPMDLGLVTHEAVHDLARTLGFKTVEHEKKAQSLPAVFAFLEQIERTRKKFQYNSDGVVVTINDSAAFRKLGYVGKAPRGSIAYKFPAEQATTVVEDIQLQVGRTGALTPVAHLTPVRVAGTTVSRATLHNADEIERLDVRVRDTVIIQKAGDIIPDILRVLKNLRPRASKAFTFPKTFMGSPVERKEGEVAHYVTDKNLPARQREALRHFISKKAFDMDKLGGKTIDLLLEQDLIKDAADLFTLKTEQLLELPGFKEKKAENIIGGIQEKKKVPFARFLYALGIRHVGEETAQALAHAFGSLERLRQASEQQLASQHDIGDVVAHSIVDYFAEKDSQSLLDKFQRVGLTLEQPKRARSTALTGKTVVVTGTLEKFTRDGAHDAIRDAGGAVSSAVSAKTDYVVAGAHAGSKAAKAKKLGVTTISEPQFIKLLG